MVTIITSTWLGVHSQWFGLPRSSFFCRWFRLWLLSSLEQRPLLLWHYLVWVAVTTESVYPRVTLWR